MREHPVVLDAALAGVLALVLVPTSVSVGGAYGGSGTAPGTLLTALVVVAVVAVRRVHPVLCAVVAYGGALVHLLVGVQILPSDVTVLVALYAVAAYGPRWASRLALVGALLGAALQGAAVFAAGGYSTAESFLTGVVVSVAIAGTSLATWTAGEWRRTRRAYVESLVERAARAEREREQQSEIATAAERARIARELHDVVAHSLSVIIAQADGGRYAAAAAPEAAVRALETVAATGRGALTDMRRLLGVLREGDGAELAPQPDAAAVPELVAGVAGSGLDVRLEERGAPRAIGGGEGLAAYRIVQEALTNVLKHAGPAARACVAMEWGPRALVITVEDDGRGAAAADDGQGRGLGGMSERATLYGGTLEAGPRPGGGFGVRAVLPYPAATATPRST